MQKWLSIFTGCLLSFTALADTQYVTDELRITLRTGEATSFQVIDVLPSGSKLQVHESNEESGYSRVTTEDGKDGWVRTQYLVKEPIARLELEKANQQLERLKTQNTELKQKLGELKTEKKSLSSESTDALSRAEKAEAELARISEVAAKPIILDKENRELRQQNVALEKELQLINQENEALKDRSQREWFIAGALVLLGGLILGLVIPKIQWKRKSSWGSF